MCTSALEFSLEILISPILVHLKCLWVQGISRSVLEVFSCFFCDSFFREQILMPWTHFFREQILMPWTHFFREQIFMTEYILNAVGTKYFFRILSNIVHISTLLGFILVPCIHVFQISVVVSYIIKLLKGHFNSFKPGVPFMGSWQTE